MNRRDLIRVISTGLVASAGTDAAAAEEMATAKVEALEASIDPRRTLLVIRFPGGISVETAERIKHYWDRAFPGTPWADVKCIVLGDGAYVDLLRLDDR